MEETKQFDVKSAFTITGILIFALAICFGLSLYQNYQQEKNLDQHEELINALTQNAISKSVVGLMCVDQNCTVQALVVTNVTENK